jgi:anti-sigma factor RsiW
MNDDTLRCPDVLERLPLHVGGDLEPEALRSVRDHLASCGECARAAEAASRARAAFVAALRAEAAAAPAPALWPAVRAALGAERARARGPRRLARPRRIAAWLVPAAAAAALVATLVLRDARPGDPPGSAPVPTRLADVAPALSPAGGLRRVALDDPRLLEEPGAETLFVAPRARPTAGFPRSGANTLAGGYR